jgi:hypothetical protein
MLAVSLLWFSGPQSPEEYQRTRAVMMATGFLVNALMILAPFPFIRRYIVTSPCLTIAVTVLATFFLLTCFGLFFGESKMPPDATEARMESITRTVAIVVAEIVIASSLYGCIAVPGKKVYRNLERGE